MNTHNKLLKKQLQRLSEQRQNFVSVKRQSELYGNIESSAEMTEPQEIKLIKKLHWEQNKSLREIGKEMNRSWWWIMDKVRRYKIPVKNRIESMKISKRIKHLQKRIFLGYWYVFHPEHLNSTPRGWLFEHRYVMSEKIGRPLKKDEVVHHKDGDKLNNKIENLELRKNGGRRKYHGVPIFCPHCSKEIS